MLPVTIVVPNHNGHHLMKRHLAGVVRAAEQYAGDVEIVVVDDASSDGSCDWLRSEWPEVVLIERPEQGGFAVACATGVDRARHEHVVLLNTDVAVSPDFLFPLIDSLEDPDTFAVQSIVLKADGRTVDESVKVPVFRGEKLATRELRDLPLEEVSRRLGGPAPTLFAGGGFMAMKRSRFHELGGFDSLYAPFYYEDVDLSYRAWKRGWKVLVQPLSVVVHHHDCGTILSENCPRDVRTMVRRNRLLFTWKNMTCCRWLFGRHLCCLTLRTMTKWLQFDWGFYLALMAALAQMAGVREARRRERLSALRSDEEVFKAIWDQSGHLVATQK